MSDPWVGIDTRIVKGPDDSVPPIVFLDYRDVEYDARLEEEMEFCKKTIEDSNINNYRIIFISEGANKEILSKLVLAMKPLFIVLFGKILSVLNKGNDNDDNEGKTRVLNYITQHKLFQFTPNDYIISEKPKPHPYIVLPATSPWVHVLNPLNDSKTKALKESFDTILKINNYMINYYRNEYPELLDLIHKINDLKSGPRLPQQEQELSLYLARLTQLEEDVSIDKLRTTLCGVSDIDAESEIILSYEQFNDFVEREIDNVDDVAFDVETNALSTMDIHHEIIGFSLATAGTNGCYVPFKSIDFKMPEKDTEQINNKLKEILLSKHIWVYNCQHEVPVVYNHYGIFLKNIKDVYVKVKLLNCGKKWENGNRSLKAQAFLVLNKKDWSEDLGRFQAYFRTLHKPESLTQMRLILSKYYSTDELDDIQNKVVECYNTLKANGQLDRIGTGKDKDSEVLSYEYVPYKLIGKYGSLDASSLFLLDDYYNQKMDSINKENKIDLYKGYDLWSKIHIAHILMEMNGFFFNDKKAEKLNKWINEKVISIMKYFVTSDLTKSWIKNKSYLFEFSRNYLMMDCIEEVVEEDYAVVMSTKNALTKDSIKFYKITPALIDSFNYLNSTTIKFYNDGLDLGINFNNVNIVKEYLNTIAEERKRKGLGPLKVTKSLIPSLSNIFYLMQGKKAEPFKVEFSKDGFYTKFTWQQFMIYYYFGKNYNEKLINEKYEEWLKEKIKTLQTFEDYKELFNINSTTADIRNYISQILLTEDIRLGHTYYKFYELYESADYEEFKEQLVDQINKNMAENKGTKNLSRILSFLNEFDDLINDSKDEEVFSETRFKLFKELFNKYQDQFNMNNYKFLKKRIKECVNWFVDPSSSLESLDSKTMEELTQLYGMLGCDIDDESSWSPQFTFMFNYKFIKKLLKAQSTYIYGSTSRENCWYVPKYYYKEGIKFPKRLGKYVEGSDLNEIYDLDQAIKIELENGEVRIFPPNKEIELVGGGTKLAKDLLPEDDIIIPGIINEEHETEENLEESDNSEEFEQINLLDEVNENA